MMLAGCCDIDNSQSTLELTCIIAFRWKQVYFFHLVLERDGCYQALELSISHDYGSGNYVMFAMTLLEVR